MKIVLLVSSLVMENDLSAIFDVKCRQKSTVRRRILVHRWEYSETPRTSRKKMILVAWYDEPLQSDGSMDSKYKFHPNFVGQPFILARENKIDYAYMRKKWYYGRSCRDQTFLQIRYYRDFWFLLVASINAELRLNRWFSTKLISVGSSRAELTRMCWGIARICRWIRNFFRIFPRFILWGAVTSFWWQRWNFV